VLNPRIIPCLLVHKKGLVKTVKFSSPKYVGDPINAVKIFNEKEADELIVIDIDASVEKREPDFTMIGHLAAECRMPLCYGGGIKTLEQAKKIIGLGVEKVAVSSGIISNPGLIPQIASEIGSQSVVAVLDVKKTGRGPVYEIFTHNGRKKTGICPVEFAEKAQSLGAGEVVINSIDNDGQMKGYDMELAKIIGDVINIPMTMLGGAGSLNDIGTLISNIGIVGCAAGSLFVFKGTYKAVLINYPSREAKNKIIDDFFQY